MIVFFNTVIERFLEYISQYSFFIDWDYYGGLFSKYFSIEGFILGAIFVLSVYFSSPDEFERISGFFKVLPIIAVINSCSVLTNFINTTFDQGFSYNHLESLINAPDNIISGFILTLVISSCYEDIGGRAFLFGIATHTALPLLNFSYIEQIGDGLSAVHMTVRIVLVGFVCVIISHRRYFFTRWIWYFCFHMLTRVVLFVLPLFIDGVYGSTFHAMRYTLSGVFEYLSRFTVDAVIFVVILAFAIMFEKGVLTVRSAKKAV